MPEESAAHTLSVTLYDLLVDDREIPDLLDDLVRRAADHFREGQDVHCGIILRRQKSKTVVATSSPLAAELDEIQTGFDEGPCLTSMDSMSVLTVQDVNTEERWPDYMKVVRDFGLASVVAVPLDLDGFGEAAINFYTRQPGLVDDDEVARAQSDTDLIAKALRIALRTAAHADTAHHRRVAMEKRTAIDMAIGIIMAQNRCAADEAFSILRRASSHRNIKIRDLAEEIVASLGHGVPDTPFEP